MASHLFGGPPLVHHEDGFNEDEAAALNSRRNLYRRVGLRGARAWSCRRGGSSASRCAPGASRRRGSSGSPTACRSSASPARRSRGRYPASSRSPARSSSARSPACARSRTCRGWSAPSPRCAIASCRLVIVGEGAGERADRRRGAPHGRRGAAAPSGLPRRSGCGDGVVRYLRSVLGQRAVPDLAGRGDGGGLPAVPPLGRRHRADGVRRQPAVDRRAGDEAASPPRSIASPTRRSRGAIGAANREKAVAEYDEKKDDSAYARALR